MILHGSCAVIMACNRMRYVVYYGCVVKISLHISMQNVIMIAGICCFIIISDKIAFVTKYRIMKRK